MKFTPPGGAICVQLCILPCGRSDCVCCSDTKEEACDTITPESGTPAGGSRSNSASAVGPLVPGTSNDEVKEGLKAPARDKLGAVCQRPLFRVSVADSGPGIAKADQSTLFDAYVQLTVGRNLKDAGTGLGLSISKRLVELHGGVIDVISQVGEGAEFYFAIPMELRFETSESDTEADGGRQKVHQHARRTAALARGNGSSAEDSGKDTVPASNILSVRRVRHDSVTDPLFLEPDSPRTTLVSSLSTAVTGGASTAARITGAKVGAGLKVPQSSREQSPRGRQAGGTSDQDADLTPTKAVLAARSTRAQATVEQRDSVTGITQSMSQESISQSQSSPRTYIPHDHASYVTTSPMQSHAMLERPAEQTAPTGIQAAARRMSVCASTQQNLTDADANVAFDSKMMSPVASKTAARAQPIKVLPVKGHVLLCEDSVATRRIVARALVRMGFDVDWVENGQQCVDIFASGSPPAGSDRVNSSSASSSSPRSLQPAQAQSSNTSPIARSVTASANDSTVIDTRTANVAWRELPVPTGAASAEPVKAATALSAQSITMALALQGREISGTANAEPEDEAPLSGRRLSVGGMQYDVILMDGVMPIKSGVEATAELRALGVRTPIVALTGNALAEDQVLFKEAGADDLLTKPVSSELLRQTIEHLMTMRRHGHFSQHA